MDEKKRDIIVERSRELFGKFGFKKTTMDDIASVCHIGKATLYYYFKNKEDVFKSVIDKEFDMFKERMSEIFSRVEKPSDKLRAFILARVTRVKELASFYSTIKDEYLEQYAFIERERQKFTDWEIQTIQGILDEGIQQGVFKETDTKLTAAGLVFALKGLEYPWIVKQTMIDIEKAAELMMPVLFSGIEK